MFLSLTITTETSLGNGSCLVSAKTLRNSAIGRRDEKVELDQHE